ncbi:MAG: M48 family metalloprotease [Pseudomonadota bacterium]|nr:M48 family metalloprotease [Pseudomonadota bacterium]
MRRFRSAIAFALASALMGSATGSTVAQTAPVELPHLGDASSALLSHDQEHYLGQLWLMQLRRQVTVLEDPQVQDYLESLLAILAADSALVDRRLTTVVVASPVLNAFAVPGGVIGVYGGLFTHAQTEAQFASVLAHELAHLAQRHFVRQAEDAQKSALPALAALLASVALAASGSGDAGLAILTSTQAAMVQRQLSFSRQAEREADNLGMANLAASGYEAQAMPDMFRQMLRARPFPGTAVPEFLSTHPLTEDRIAESANRADQLRGSGIQDRLEFQLMRARVRALLPATATTAIKQFRSELASGQTGSRLASEYGLAVALARDGRNAEALAALDRMLDRLNQDPLSLDAVALLQAQIALQQGDHETAHARLSAALALHPNRYPLLAAQAELSSAMGEHVEAERQWARLSRSRPNDPWVWQKLMEARGKIGNLRGVHLARAEHLTLHGELDQAIDQLQYALQLSGDNFAEQARIREQLERLRELRTQIQRLG